MDHHGMMHGYSGYPNMMSPDFKKQYEENYKKHNQFLDETKELRKELHALKFEYHEALRSSPESSEDLNIMREKMSDLQQKIYEKGQKNK